MTPGLTSASRASPRIPLNPSSRIRLCTNEGKSISDFWTMRLEPGANPVGPETARPSRLAAIVPRLPGVGPNYVTRHHPSGPGFARSWQTAVRCLNESRRRRKNGLFFTASTAANSSRFSTAARRRSSRHPRVFCAKVRTSMDMESPATLHSTRARKRHNRTYKVGGRRGRSTNKAL
jgi:hypothetical protein